MSHDRKHEPASIQPISTERENEVRYWMKHFAVTRDRLLEALRQVGNSREAVRHYLGCWPSAGKRLSRTASSGRRKPERGESHRPPST